MELRVIVDQMVAPVPGGIGRYTEELTRALIQTAPRGVAVSGVVAASPEPDYALITERLPGLAHLHKSVLGRAELAAAWQHGFTRLPGSGMLHATSLFCPLYRHDRVGRAGDQIVVTIHDVIAWTHPETITPRGVSWHRAMTKRAQRYADAVVVPTHAVAAELAEIADFGDRIRVISGAVGSRLALPPDPSALLADLDLPERFVLAVGTLEPRKSLGTLVAAMSHVPDDVALVVAGPNGWGDVDLDRLAVDAGLAPARVRAVGYIADDQLAALFAAADVFAFPSLAEGFGLPLLEAFSLGVPVVHSDAPALIEVAGGAGLVVERDDAAGYPARFAGALTRVLDDQELADRLRVLGTDRARSYSWRDSAEKVWQLHADL